MEVQVQRTSIIPARNAGAAASEVPLTVFDLFAPNYHVTVLFAFSPPNPANDILVTALSATLQHFPLLTARLGHSRDRPHRPCFVTGHGGAGALVVEAMVSSKLSAHLPLVPSPELALLHQPTKGTQHMLQLQINRFACGGLVISSSSHHQAADGYSMSKFLHAWTLTVRGMAPLDHLISQGPGALVPRHPPRCEFKHRGAEFLPLMPDQISGEETLISQAVNVDPSKITNILLYYPSELIAKLKASVQNKYTTFETLSGHTWRKVTAARGLDGAMRTSIRVSVDGRRRLGVDVVPEGFFGNVVLTASSDARVSAVIGGGLAEAAELLHEGIRSVDGRYFQSFVDFGAEHCNEELVPVCAEAGNVLSPDVEAESWLGFELRRLDFGCGGRLRGLVPAKVPVDGLVLFLPGMEEEGGVEVFVALLEEHAKELRRIAHTLD